MKDLSNEQQHSVYYNLRYTPNESNEKNNPFLVLFPYNFPKVLTINDSDEVQWQLGENKEKKLKNDKSLIGLSSRIQYESRSKLNLNRSDYVLGFISKKTQRTISIYDIDGIFPMHQKILKIDEDKSKRIEIIDDKHTYANDKQELMEQFGTSKAKKLALNMKTNVVDESNISSVQNAKYILQQKAMDNDTLSNSEEIKKNQLFYMNEILPTFDIETTDVRKIFDYESKNESVKEIDHKPVLKMVKGNGKLLHKNKEQFTEFAYDYLSGLIQKINEGKNLSNKIKYTIYINELISFYLLPKNIQQTPQKISEDKRIELSHVNKMIDKYTKQTSDSSGRLSYIRSPMLILKNIYHILVLALLLNGYEFNYTSLAKSMRIEMKKVMSYYREIGCSFKTEKKTNGNDSKKVASIKSSMDIVKLNAPLKLNFNYNQYSKKK